MPRTLPFADYTEGQTEVFRPDYHHMIRQHLRIQLGWLVIFVFLIYLNLTSQREAEGISFWIAGIYLMFALATLAVLYRSRRNAVVLALSPQGVSFPMKDVGPIDWQNVKQVKIVHFGGRVDVTSVRFYFSENMVNRRQFGSVHKDRWEVIFSVKGAFGYESLRIQGGAKAMLDSIERYHVVEGR